MNQLQRFKMPIVLCALSVGLLGGKIALGQEPAASGGPDSGPVGGTEDFGAVVSRMSAAKPQLQASHLTLLQERYDLSDRVAPGVTMSRGKPVQAGVRVKLPAGVTWDDLAAMTPEEIRTKGLWPAGFYPLPHPNQDEGGMLFPQTQIDEVQTQTGRDLIRFDLDFVMPDHFLPEFPPAMYLTTRPDLGDVSQGQLVTSDNYYELFNEILNPKQLDGLRLLLTPFPQQQFNATADRRSLRPSLGVACFDCHANGHTNAATHLAGDIRPQAHRHRIDTPSLRGVAIQRLYGSQRAIKTIEDFTEFEQRASYFDGDPASATSKGVNVLDRGTQVQFMSEVQSILDFPPAPKLDVFGRLYPDRASDAERRGEELFFGKARCSACHGGQYFLDNRAHNLQSERFYEPAVINGRVAAGDGLVKTFPLRGIRDSPPYLHDGRLLTLEDTVEYFNLLLGTKLTSLEKQDLVAFLRVL